MVNSCVLQYSLSFPSVCSQEVRRHWLYHVIGSIKDAANGIYEVTHYMQGVTTQSKRYDDYQKVYSQPPNSTTAYNYDAI